MSEGPVIRVGEWEIPHDELKLQAARLAGALAAHGVEFGERVAIVLRNDPDFLLVSAACGVIGAVPVPVNWHWRGEELRHVLTHSSSKAVFAHSAFVDDVEAALPDGVPLVEVPVRDEQAAAYGAAALTGRYPVLDEWLAEHEPHAEPLDAAPMSLIYTSGTTGLPKGVIRSPMTPEQSQQVAMTTLNGMGLKPGMRTIVTAPMYHSAPNAQSLFSVALGIDLTVMARFDPERFLAIIEEQRITHAQVVPTMFVRLLELPDEIKQRYDLSSLEAVVHAAAPCPGHVKKRMIEWFGPVILEYYGGTETGIVVTCDSAEWLAHEGTVGKPVADADIHVFDPLGELLPQGETGEIYVKPPHFWPGFTYLGQEDKRREIDRDGYLSIGDVGRVDSDGFLYLSDRARDMVISGGVNIYPIEIEGCVLELPGVRDVAVFGIPDDSYGEALAAHVDVHPDAALTEDEIRDHVRHRLAGYKVPRVIVFDDQLPREESGKIFKRRIRERYWQDAGRTI
ncbi:MAG TPA: AMP-binding protein [Solirubrobacteraceae bacterium]|nr:AMP-binding protein [Solirubrobacteraceae bacterium]